MLFRAPFVPEIFVRVVKGHLTSKHSDHLINRFYVLPNLPTSALSKLKLSHWILETIFLCYSAKCLQLSQGVRVQSTRGMATYGHRLNGLWLVIYVWLQDEPLLHFCAVLQLVTAPLVAHSVLSAEYACRFRLLSQPSLDSWLS